jgi:hypothetical protein
VDIAYNTDGSPTDFPFPVAEGVRLGDGSVVWTVPDTRSPACRLQLSSPEEGLVLVSEVFSIVGPTILLEEPGEGDTWVAGETALVTWRNLGFTGDTVSIFYNTTGSEEDFPHRLAGAAPNTGEAQVVVPAAPTPTFRVMIVSDDLPELVSVSDVLAVTLPLRRTRDRPRCLVEGEPLREAHRAKFQAVLVNEFRVIPYMNVVGAVAG